MTARLEVERPATHPVSHPLEPLSAAEVAAASAIVRKVRELPASTRFITITLHEPPKERVLALGEGQQLDREAFVVLRDREQRATYETVVSLTLGELLSWREVPGAQPGLTFGEFLACEDVVRADPRWQAAMRRTVSEPDEQQLCMNEGDRSAVGLADACHPQRLKDGLRLDVGVRTIWAEHHRLAVELGGHARAVDASQEVTVQPLARLV
jgi:Cu2+-containing amine oxidase